jgi:F-type H+-transporting ATPase subunit b
MEFFLQPASWVLVAFIIFISLVFFFKIPSMLGRLLDDKIQSIKNELDQARELKEDANTLLAEYERKIEYAKDEADEIISRSELSAKSYEEISNKKSEELIARFEKQSLDRIKQAEKSAISKISEEMINKSINISEKIIKENMSDQNSDQLFTGSIEQIKKLND